MSETPTQRLSKALTAAPGRARALNIGELAEVLGVSRHWVRDKVTARASPPHRRESRTASVSPGAQPARMVARMTETVAVGLAVVPRYRRAV